MVDRTAEDMAQDREIAALKDRVKQLEAAIANLGPRVDAVDSRSHESEGRIKVLEDDPRRSWPETHETRITDLEALKPLLDHLDRLVGHVSKDDDKRKDE